MTLDDYLNTPNPDGSRKSRGDFARRIGVTPQMISAYCRRPGDPKRLFPSSKALPRIYAESDGLVTANDFFGMAPTSGENAA